MDFRVLKYFEAVAKFRNITKASEHLKIAQPSISQQIRDLEKEMGVKLFQRSKKGVVLTIEGQQLLQRVKPLLRQYEELLNYASGENEERYNHLTLGIFPGISKKLSLALSDYWAENPNVNITVREGQSNFILSLVRKREAQLGICRLPILSPELEYDILGNDFIHAVLCENDPLAQKNRIMPRDLHNRRLLLIRSNYENSKFSQIIQSLEEHGVKPNVVGRMESVASLLHLIRQGLGIGLIPKSTISLSPIGLRTIPFGDIKIHIPTAVVWFKNESNPMVFKLKDKIIKHCSFETKII